MKRFVLNIMPSFRRRLFYGLLFLVGIVLVDTYMYYNIAQVKYYDIIFWSMLIAPIIISIGQFGATIFYFVKKDSNRGFFYLFQFLFWLFITWLTFVIEFSFIGIGFNSVPLKE